MKPYTGMGDYGETSIIGGKRIAKDDERIEAEGQIDELNSILGVVLSFSSEPEIKEVIERIQKDLFVIGADISTEMGGKIVIPRLSPTRIEYLEKKIDEFSAEIPSIKSFILPGGSKTASLLHFARTVCRTAERRVVKLMRKNKINEAVPKYLNRLSDLLFVMARWVNYKKKIEERLWR